MTEFATSRRRFLAWLSATLGAVAATAVGVPVVGFFFAPLVRRPTETWRSVGPVSAFRIGETVEVRISSAAPVPWAGEAADMGAWLRRQGPRRIRRLFRQLHALGLPRPLDG